MIVSVNIMGGLGNQLFQIAAAYAYAKKQNGILQIVKKLDNGNRPVYWDSVLKKIEPYLVNILPDLEHWSEKDATVYTEIGPLLSPGKYLHGYLQSSKYFNDCSEIKELFTDDTRTDQMKTKYKFLCDNKERVIVVHARRTDYITFKEVHGPLDVCYYKKALDQMLPKIDNPILVLTSDDNSFWDEIPDIKKYNCVIIHDTDINTFYLLQQFNNFIMANSSFIWWVVWLSNAKNVIAPSKWFGPQGPHNYEDIYEPNWIRI